jgi:hypothetical protein
MSPTRQYPNHHQLRILSLIVIHIEKKRIYTQKQQQQQYMSDEKIYNRVRKKMIENLLIDSMLTKCHNTIKI